MNYIIRLSDTVSLILNTVGKVEVSNGYVTFYDYANCIIGHFNLNDIKGFFREVGGSLVE